MESDPNRLYPKLQGVLHEQINAPLCEDMNHENNELCAWSKQIQKRFLLYIILNLVY